MTLAELLALPKTVPKAPRSQKLNDDRLVVLRLGLGRDSMTMLVLLAAGELVVEGKARGPDEVDAVVFTDPGHEWSFTYDLIPRVQAFCARYGLRFLVQSKPPKDGPKGWLQWMQHQMRARVQAEARGLSRGTFGTPTWRLNPPASIEARCATGYYHDRIPLFDDYGAKDAWISKDDSSCTINHKIKPNRELLVDLMVERFGEQDTRGLGEKLPYTRQGAGWGREVAAGNRRSHLMLIGYAADEKKRLVEARRAEGKREGWAKGFDSEAYPLIEMGIDKGDEQAVLESHLGVAPDGRFKKGGFSDVKKSGCRSCIHQDAAQWWMLKTLDADYFEQIVAHEKRVVARTGPWQAVFPKGFVARLARTGQENPLVADSRRQGWRVTFAQKVERDGVSKWEPVSVFDTGEEGVRAFVWIPIADVVARWEADYRAKHGRAPQWEEVARKEYRGCPMESL